MSEEVVVNFPKAEITPEERARRLQVEVERLASLPPAEWLFYLTDDGIAEKHGIERADLKAMIEATIRVNEKKARENKADDRQREQRAEKKEERIRREQKRERERAEKEAERKRKEREKAFEAIAKLPRVAHELRLAELAKRFDEDVDLLRDEFAAFIGPDPETLGLEPWDEPVDTRALLNELMAGARCRPPVRSVLPRRVQRQSSSRNGAVS